ncbi:MAG: hypothetical protein IJH84_10515 [Saccharopolyspora sp.]|uniref:hypothetical protein n=1 Tax=Saccharopolyspora TaxID=1835 RepID=UPI00190B55E2|nr:MULTISPECIES: hypothetical protein [unclassified Saccharopolyspora]MBK0866871.1 hypothetical protein [Saccharopolyspora sp. HNM0986]MBQ6641448.1 hypothetical protein [Saccharopolyspora sp.]
MASRTHPADPQLAPTLSLESQLACGVCGHHALTESADHDRADDPRDRLICQICGAHRLV